MGFLLVPVGVYLAISMSSDMDIGARHLLPVWAFLYVLIGAVAAVLLDRDMRWGICVGGIVGLASGDVGEGVACVYGVWE